MIASLRGILRSSGKDYVVLETGGIGFLVYVPRPVLAAAGAPGETVFLHTLLIVREDSLTLYGFSDTEQRSLFETLLSITGVGPRVALNLLSFLTLDDMRLAVAQKDLVRFTRVPGIGKKMAERLVLELKGKLDLTGLPTVTDAEPALPSPNSELIDLLVSLGYSSTEAQGAVASLPPDAPPDLEERLRLVLRSFGSA